VEADGLILGSFFFEMGSKRGYCAPGLRGLEKAYKAVSVIR
jgi:hypothetical protein